MTTTATVVICATPGGFVWKCSAHRTESDQFATEGEAHYLAAVHVACMHGITHG